MQIGPNPLLMGRHYPLDVAAQCDVRDTLRGLTEALTRCTSGDAWRLGAPARARCATFAKLLIEREENLVREHQHDAIMHPERARGAPGAAPAARTR